MIPYFLRIGVPLLGMFVLGCGGGPSPSTKSPTPAASVAASKPDPNPPAQAKEDAKPRAPAPGEIAPDFLFQPLGGEAKKLSSLRGKPVLLEFWASWCPDCHKAAPALNELEAKFASRGVQFLSISTDKKKSAEEVQKVAESLGMKLPLMIDSKEDPVSKRYGIQWIPTFFVLDSEGKVRGEFRDLKGESLAQLTRFLDSLTKDLPQQ